MSQENVELARAMHEAFNDGDTDFVVDQPPADLEWQEDTAAFPGDRAGCNSPLRSGRGTRCSAVLAGRACGTSDVPRQ
jgi:hypothetical protein